MEGISSVNKPFKLHLPGMRLGTQDIDKNENESPPHLLKRIPREMTLSCNYIVFELKKK